MSNANHTAHTGRIAGFVLAMLAVAFVLAGHDARAGVVSITNANQPFEINLNVPAVVGPNPADGVIHAWDEVQEFTLARRMRVNKLASTGRRGYVAAGTTINSHMIQWDSTSDWPPTDHALADIKFDGQIIAVIFGTKTIRKTNGLSLPGIINMKFKYQGLERGDRIILDDDPTALMIDWITGHPGDWIRVITAPAVPVPPTGDDDDDDDDDNTPPTGDDDDDDDNTPPTGDDDDDDDNTPPTGDDDDTPTIAIPAPSALPAGLALMSAAMLRRRRRR